MQYDFRVLHFCFHSKYVVLTFYIPVQYGHDSNLHSGILSAIILHTTVL